MAAKGISLTKIAHQCAHCKNEFFPKRTDRLLYCSRQCAFAAKAARARHTAPAKPPKIATCKVCGVAFQVVGPQCICSDQCRKSLARTKAKQRDQLKHSGKTCTCMQCGSVFMPRYGSKRRTYCSAECARKGNRKQNVRGTNRKRARAHGVAYQYVNPIKVLRRDNWTCQLCGRKTPQALRGTYDDRAPELDHIMPISKGGAHSYANVQCACRACNMAKGDKPMGQHQLFA